MIIVKQMELRDNMKHYLDLAYNGEDVIVPRVGGRNIAIISEKSYQEYQKYLRNREYLRILDESMAQARDGKVVYTTIEDLKKMKQGELDPQDIEAGQNKGK